MPKPCRESKLKKQIPSGTWYAAECISLIKKTDSIARCREKARAIADEAKASLGFAPDSVYKRSLIGLIDFFVSRDR